MLKFLIFETIVVTIITIIYFVIKIKQKLNEIKKWHSVPDAGFQGSWSFFDWIKFVVSSDD